jgi:nucleoside-diphosphate-sugar epimerase
MKVFLAGAGGAIGRRLTPLLCAAGHIVIGTTRSPDKAQAIAALGAEPVVVDVFDAPALERAVKAAAPEIVMHQLTDLPFAPGTQQYADGLARNARLRVEGTRNLAAAARAAGVTRLIAQSIAFVYAPGGGLRVESDPLDSEGVAAVTVTALKVLEETTLASPEGIVLRYGYLYGPGTWFESPAKPPSVHVDAAAHAALLALTKGEPGVYNIAEDDGYCASDKAKRDLGFDAGFRSRSHPSRLAYARTSG